jgi:hypothetical protein
MIYDVEQSVLARNVGYGPAVRDGLYDLIDGGPLVWGGSRQREIRRSAARFVPEVASTFASCDSMLTVRAVLPNRDLTDERPVVVQQTNARTMHVLPGKIASSLSAADEVVKRCRE